MVELENLLKSNISTLSKKKMQKEITFSFGEVILTLGKGGNAMFKLYLSKMEGEHLIYPDNGSDTRINLKNLRITSTDGDKEEVLLSPFETKLSENFEDKMNLCTFRKRDSYLSVGTDAKWYTIDYLELNLLPLIINFSKAQIEFIIEFFITQPATEASEEDARNMVLTNKQKTEKREAAEVKATADKKEAAEDNNPIFYRLVRMNETELLLSFHISEGSAFVSC